MTPFANPLINFVPPAVNITAITNAKICVITTATPHGYNSGIYCTIVIPYPGVMEEINGKTYLMLPVTPTQLIPLASFSPNPYVSGSFLDTTNIGPFTTGPTIRTVTHAPTPSVRVPPGPPPPPFVPVVAFVPAQQAQVVPSGEFGTVLLNASNVIGPNNPTG